MQNPKAILSDIVILPIANENCLRYACSDATFLRGNIMIICICRAVSDTAIKKVVEEQDILGIHELKQCMQVCDQCTCCKNAIEEIIEEVTERKCCV